MFTETKCVSFEELGLYTKGSLASKEKHRIEQHLIDCELCSAAVSGFAAVPVTADDISELHGSIDRMAGKKAWHTSNWAIGGGLIATAMVILFFVFNPFGKKKEIASSEQQVSTGTEQSYNDEMKVPPPVFETETAEPSRKTPPRENFIRPVKKESIPPTTVITPANTAPMEQPVVKNEVKEPVKKEPEPVEEIVEIAYNAPVRYIEDLKITDFDKLYTRPIDLRRTHNNLPAWVENKDKKDPFREYPETERLIGADKVLEKGLRSFNKKQWAEAIPQFDLLLEQNEKDLNALFYKGVCAWNIDRHLIAQKCFMQVIEADNNAFHQEARWYLALTYIKAGEAATARELLEEIIAEKGFYSKKAKEQLLKMQ